MFGAVVSNAETNQADKEDKGASGSDDDQKN
jgi:hypothetical protein